MKVQVAYVVHEDPPGGAHILGVHAIIKYAKEACQAHFDQHVEPSHDLEWVSFAGSDGEGVQSIHQGKMCYYIEEVEFAIEAQVSQGMTSELLHQIQLSGDLAKRVEEFSGMIEPLEKREAQLGLYIDHLLDKLNLDSLEFIIDGQTEMWIKGEPK